MAEKGRQKSPKVLAAIVDWHDDRNIGETLRFHDGRHCGLLDDVGEQLVARENLAIEGRKRLGGAAFTPAEQDVVEQWIGVPSGNVRVAHQVGLGVETA